MCNKASLTTCAPSGFKIFPSCFFFCFFCGFYCFWLTITRLGDYTSQITCSTISSHTRPSQAKTIFTLEEFNKWRPRRIVNRFIVKTHFTSNLYQCINLKRTDLVTHPSTPQLQSATPPPKWGGDRPAHDNIKLNIWIVPDYSKLKDPTYLNNYIINHTGKLLCCLFCPYFLHHRY